LAGIENILNPVMAGMYWLSLYQDLFVYKLNIEIHVIIGLVI